MKRILPLCLVLLLTAIYARYFLPGKFMTILFITCFTATLIKLIVTKENKKKFVTLFCVGFFLVGFILTERATIAANTTLTRFDGRTVILTCRICSFPKVKNEYTSVDAEVISFSYGEKTYKDYGKIKLTFEGTDSMVSFGDIITGECDISLPSEFQNRGGYDYRLYLLTKKIYTQGFISKNAFSVISSKNYKKLDYFMLLNNKLCRNIESLFPEDESEIINAVSLGEQSSMDFETYAFYKNSGLVHIIVVSGTHMTYLALIFVKLKKWLKINSKLYLILPSFAVIFFMGLTGFSPSVARAGFMALCAFAASVLNRKFDPVNALCASAIILLLINPYTAFDLGFLLSYVSTLGILLLALPLMESLGNIRLFSGKAFYNKILKEITSIIIIGLCAQFFTLPIVTYISGEIPLWSTISTLAITHVSAIVLVGGLIISLLSLMSMPVARCLSTLLSPFVKIFSYIVEFFGDGSGILRLGKADIYCCLLYANIFIIFMLMTKRKRKRTILVFVSLSVFVTGAYGLNFSKCNTYANVSFINVGQGDSTLVSLPGGVDILIDGGKYNAHEYSNPFSYTVTSYLLKQGVSSVEYMIASHADSDHSSGLIAVMESLEVNNLIIPDGFGESNEAIELIKTAEEKDIPIYEFSQGGNIKMGENANLKILMPDDVLLNRDNENDKSLVLNLTYGETSFLFTGDAGIETEKHIISECPIDDIDCDVLKVAHHGSKYSTCGEFLDAVSPEFAVIPVGDNSYGHPSDEILNALSERNIETFRSDINKDVVFVITPDRIKNIIYS